MPIFTFDDVFESKQFDYKAICLIHSKISKHAVFCISRNTKLRKYLSAFCRAFIDDQQENVLRKHKKKKLSNIPGQLLQISGQ